MRKNALIFSLLFLIAGKIHSQSESNTSAGGKNDRNDFSVNQSAAGSVEQTDDSNVDLYTGMLKLSLPIYDVKQSGVSVPVKLSFYSDGVKVNDTPGWTGTGWKLSAGGSIMREVRGNPDEDIKAVASNGNVYYQNYGRFHDLLAVTSDRQRFQFPLGNLTDNKMQYYINLLKNNLPIDCKYWGNNFDCGGKCHDYLLELLATNTSNMGDGQLENTVFFWDVAADTQPDIFHFTLPTGGGKFILDQDGKPTLLEGDPDIKIEPAIGPFASLTNPAWKITTPDGTVYEFPYTDAYTDKASTKFLSYLYLQIQFLKQKMTKQEFDALPDMYVKGAQQSTLQRTVTNVWYLAKIKTAKNNDDIVFKYKPQATIEEFRYDEQKLDLIKSYRNTFSQHLGIENNENCNSYHIRPSSTYAQVSYASTGLYENINSEGTMWVPVLNKLLAPKYLDEIVFNSGKLQFLPSSADRIDLPGNKVLEKINLFDNSNKLIKSFNLYYDYFTSADFVNNEISKRLKLTGMREYGNGTKSNKYAFEYYEDFSLPSKYSNKQDFWGFYNNNTANTLLPSGSRSGVTLTGADRSPDESRMKTGMLKKIIYPTGGYKKIFYEINKNLSTQLSNLELPVGGLRVNKIISGADVSVNPEITTDFAYSEGFTVNYLDYNWMRHFMNDTYFTAYYDDKIHTNFYVKRSSEPIRDFIRTKGGLVGYGSVTVSKGNGKNVKRFTNPSTNPDEYGSKIVIPFREEAHGETYSEPEHMSKDALRGLEKSIEYYDSANKLVKSVSNEYVDNPDLMTPFSITAMKVTSNLTYLYGTNYNRLPSYLQKTLLLNFYDNKAFFPYLKKRTEKNYDLGSQSFVENTKMFYKESNTHNQITRLTESSVKGLKEVKRYFPGESVFQGDAVLNDMKSKNIINTPVKMESYLGGVKLNEQLATYFKNPADLNYIFPSDIYGANFPNSFPNLNGVGPLEKLKTFHKYDDKGNVLEFSNEAGIHIVALWGYNKTLPVAKIENSTYNDIPSSLIADIQNYSNAGDQANLLIALNNLRNLAALANSMVTTYTHYPLIGERSITDPKGQTIFYEYDEFNRLKQVKDHLGNILTEKEYRFKNN
jgi:hypothetical protein